ncbi:hypothetical protein [Bacilliculturomica massiliensis]|uniref:hypothetical protein n=1 Tax=Bacilliculturomica massiliensis TaxID=1917867 RepID=UPI00102F69B4|nr:hypothetical protein [Bacilliculturomica massiliensis]
MSVFLCGRSGKTLPKLVNPAGPSDIRAGREAIGEDGKIISGTAEISYHAKGTKQTGSNDNFGIVMIPLDVIPVPIKTVRVQVSGPGLTSTYTAVMEATSSDGLNFRRSQYGVGGNCVTFDSISVQNGYIYISVTGVNVDLSRNLVYAQWCVFSD